MNRMIGFLLLLLLAACNDHDETRVGVDSSIARPISPSKPRLDLTGCYMRVLQRDTLTASLIQEGNNITGKLTFDNYQKDGSSGMVSGKIDGDVLKLVYRFQSEGTNSIAEVYFRIVPGGLIHGWGDVQVKGDSAYYSDVPNIRYNENEKLLKLPCDDLPAKYR